MQYYEVAFDKPLDSYTYTDLELNQKSIPNHLIFHRVLVPFGKSNKKQIGFVISKTPVSKISSSIKYKSITDILDEGPIIEQKDFELATWIANYYFCSVGEALRLFFSYKKHTPLKKKISFDNVSDFARVNLSEEQKKVYSAILKSPKNIHYLHGITGSGKTFIYIELIKQIIKQKKQVLLLLPEINLVHQLYLVIKKYLTCSIATYHSYLTSGQKIAIKNLFFQNKINLIIGTRSSLFLRSNHLGAIIIDEEHDTSYKNNTTPRYQTRHIAQFKAKQYECLLILGSATPSVDMYYHLEKESSEESSENSIKEQKKLPYKFIIPHYLGKRYNNILLPEVTQVKSTKKNNEVLEKSILKEILHTLDLKEQVIIFFNQRGFAHSVICSDCGFLYQCINCQITLNYHKNREKLICHYCGYQIAFTKECMECKSDKLSFVGMGTEKIYEELEKLFMEYNLVRFDSDTASSPNKIKKILLDFEQGKTNLLIGTQMIAKGHSFPKVSLVVILYPEQLLSIPDFRSNERLFSQVTQVAGRSGRFEKRGRVIIQTKLENNPLLDLASDQNYEEFYREEIIYRQKHHYPPFVKLCRLVVRSENFQIAQKESLEIYKQIVSHLKDICEAFPPSPCILPKIKRNFRWNVIVKIHNVKAFLKQFEELKNKFNPSPNHYLEIDMEPVELW